MTNDIAIRVNGLGKKYRISHESAAYKTLGETITNAAKAPIRRLRGAAPSRSTEEFWALRDVSFEVKRGEVLGIIGRNGAGKSTLLKILSRITTPTEGTVEVHGRIGSLLEVGTGFHPELSGRENIYLSGSILGMKRTEIDAKFAEIVKFAEMEKFLDTPVKRYSSGMYVRLAFAVAAHLEPEILIIDEVLAVGDAAFQKKCLGKMGDVASEGRTVLFVSHNMAAVSNLCNKGIVLRNGKIAYISNSITDTIHSYLQQIDDVQGVPIKSRIDRKGAGRIRIVDFRVVNVNQEVQDTYSCGQQVSFHIYYENCQKKPSDSIIAGISISTETGEFLTVLSNEYASSPIVIGSDSGIIYCTIKKLPLPPGKYYMNLIIRQNEIVEDWLIEGASLHVENGDFFGTGRLPPHSHSGLLLDQEWGKIIE